MIGTSTHRSCRAQGGPLNRVCEGGFRNRKSLNCSCPRVTQRDASRVTERRPRNEWSFTFVIDARVLYVALDARRLIGTRDLLILLIAHKDTAAQRRERQLPTVGGNMTKVRWRSRIREGALSLLALATLLSVLYVADARVREGATHIASTTSNTSVVRSGSQFAADTSRVLLNIREGGVQNAAMTAFVGTAAVLLLFMLKT
jgi:hypothetical protein